ARVEALVTEKIEARLREISEIDVISSTSRTGISSVQIELSQFISATEIEQTWSEIRDALADAAIEFPPGVPEPEFDNDRTGAFTALISITAAEGREVLPNVMGRVAEDLRQQLRQVPNTKLVELYGAPTEEIRVEIDADALATLGITPDEVARAIGAADTKVTSGRVRGGGTDYLIEIAGEIDGLQRVREVPVQTGRDGQVVRVGDIGSVSRAVEDPASSLAFVDGNRAVIVAVRVEDDKQVDRWAGFIREELAAAEDRLPGGLRMTLLFDQSTYTADRLGEVATNMVIGIALVIAVLFVSMGWRSAVIVGAMLPLTSLMSLVILEKLGITIHQMSVTGLIVALGLLVDAAIVTTDEIRRRLQAGMAREAAVGEAVRRLAVPLGASTVTTVLAFVPMAALPGPAGDFVGAIALSVIVMLFCSLLLALTITPAVAGFLLPDRASRPRWWRDGLQGGLVGRGFSRLLDLSLNWRGLALFAAAVPAIVGFLAFPTLKAQFFPEVSRDQFHIQIELANGTAIDRTAEVARAADRVLAEIDGIRKVQWVVGRSAPAF
ncbi:MAG: efflux RND transporter permease subunit, partial [Pseudomonadota bacterium]